eukprot:scaffold208493_cov27-Tisochrysis_lutea.AAC.2
MPRKPAILAADIWMQAEHTCTRASVKWVWVGVAVAVRALWSTSATWSVCPDMLAAGRHGRTAAEVS